MPKSLFSGRYKKFCAVLRTVREEAGVTQADLARRLGRPQSFVSKVETGERRLDLVELLDWLRALRVSHHDFIERLGL